MTDRRRARKRKVAAGGSASEDSRAAILDAAAAEFAAHGFSGARMEHIAERSGYNKALLYRYFKGRDNLIKEVLRRELARRQAILEAAPPDPGLALVHWFRATVSPDAETFTRLLQQEALHESGEQPVEAAARRRYYRGQIAAVQALQEHGELDDAVPADVLFLALQALIAWPAAFPQVVRLACGADPRGSRFRRDWEVLLHRVAELLVDAAAGQSRRSKGGEPDRRKEDELGRQQEHEHGPRRSAGPGRRKRS
jgi:AcrR family transcriptional regulator